MHVYLKVKIKSLAAEAQTIRKEERRVNISSRERKRMARTLELGIQDGTNSNGIEGRMPLSEAYAIRLQKKLERSRNILANPKSSARQLGLHRHRIGLVRKESRHSFIAYGFLRGLDYKQIENTTKPIDWAKVERMVETYSEDDPRVTLQKFAEWKDASGMVPKE